MDKINRIYKNAGLFDGVYKEGVVIFNRKRSIINELQNIILFIVFIEHLLIFISDNKFLKDHLIYFKIFDEDFGSRYVNFAAGGGTWLISLPLIVYQTYTKNPDNYRPFGFLFCLSANEIHSKYKLSLSRSKNQFKFQSIFFRFSIVLARYYATSFGLIIIKTSYESILRTSTNYNYLNCFLNSIKIFILIWFILSFVSVALRFFIIFGEFVICCKYLTNRLDDEIDKIFQLFSNRKYLDKRYLNRRILILSKNYNLILRDQKTFNYHFNRTLLSTFVLLTFTFLHPTIVLFEPDKGKYTVYFHSFNTFLAYLIFSILCLFSKMFTDSNNRFWKSFSMLSKFSDIRPSIKIFNIYCLNNDPDFYTFNIGRLFPFHFRFLLFWFLENFGISHPLLINNLLGLLLPPHLEYKYTTKRLTAGLIAISTKSTKGSIKLTSFFEEIRAELLKLENEFFVSNGYKIYISNYLQLKVIIKPQMK